MMVKEPFDDPLQHLCSGGVLTLTATSRLSRRHDASPHGFVLAYIGTLTLAPTADPFACPGLTLERDFAIRKHHPSFIPPVDRCSAGFQ